MPPPVNASILKEMVRPYALKKTGDLQGCLYIFVEYANCTQSGVYYERGVETFVGWYRETPARSGQLIILRQNIKTAPSSLEKKLGVVNILSSRVAGKVFLMESPGELT